MVISLQLIVYCELLEEHHKYVIARQLLRSGTSVGANAREAQNSESRSDFIHKLKISAKEANETAYHQLITSSAKTGTSAPNVRASRELISHFPA